MDKQAMLAEQSIRDMCHLLTRLTAGECSRPLPELTFYRSVPGFYHRAMLSALPPEREEAAMDAILSSGIPLVSYTQGGVSDAFQERLSAAGFVKMVTQAGMALPLADAALETDAHVVRVSPADIRRWSDTVTNAMEKPDETPGFVAMSGCDECRFYAYEKDGQWLGTTLLYTKDGNAGIHEVGVLRSHRRRGIATKLLRHALCLAREDGAELATLQASPMGELTYTGLGFRRVSAIDNWRKGK